MKTIYELTEDDIRTILATHFNVSEDNVDIYYDITTVGCHINEHDVPYLKAQIALDKKGRRIKCHSIPVFL